jgi:large subunit ribosomal protein L18
MKTTQKKTDKRLRLKRKIRMKVSGTATCPRLSVYRSNNCIYAQAIDDTTATTVASASDVAIKTGTKTERSEKVGTQIAEALKAKKITSVVFDRNGFKYIGRVKLLADAARAAGLQF